MFSQLPGIPPKKGFRLPRFASWPCHFLISACPSAKEKPHAPLWYEAGTSPHAELFLSLEAMKKPSLMTSGFSSRVSQVEAGFGTEDSLRNCRHEPSWPLGPVQ